MHIEYIQGEGSAGHPKTAGSLFVKNKEHSVILGEVVNIHEPFAPGTIIIGYSCINDTCHRAIPVQETHRRCIFERSCGGRGFITCFFIPRRAACKEKACDEQERKKRV